MSVDVCVTEDAVWRFGILTNSTDNALAAAGVVPDVWDSHASVLSNRACMHCFQKSPTVSIETRTRTSVAPKLLPSDAPPETLPIHAMNSAVWID